MAATKYVDFNDTLARTGLPAPTDKDQEFIYDLRTSGLALRITRNNARTWIMPHWDARAGCTRRHKIGNVFSVTTSDARKAVQVRAGNVAIGRPDPFFRQKLKRDTITLGSEFEDYLANRDLKPRTVADYRYRVETEGFKDWLKRPLGDITRDDVQRLHRKLTKEKTPSRARGAFVVLRAVFRHAIDRHVVDGKPLFTDNPVRVLSATKSWGKQRRKTSAIPLRLMPRYFKAARAVDSVASDCMQLIAYTGLRRNEAARLPWANVNLRAGTYTVDDRKSEGPLHLPITKQARAIFEKRWKANKAADVPSLYVFPARGSQDAPLAEPRKVHNAICEVIEYPSTIHDLRRSFIGAADASGLPFMIVKLLVGHKLPSATGDVTMGYTAPDSEPMLHAAQRVADILDGTATTASVARLNRGKGHGERQR